MEIQHCTPKVVKLGPGKYNTARPKNWFRDGLTAQAVKSGDAGVVEFVRRNPVAVIYRTFSGGGAIINIATTPAVLVVHPSIPATSVKELIALAQRKPGELNYGSSGVGGLGHMCALLFSTMTGTKMTHGGSASRYASSSV